MSEFPEEHIFIGLTREKGYKRLVEVGVFSGTLTNRVVSILEREQFGLERYLCVDPWQVYIDYYHRDHLAKEADPNWWEEIYKKAEYVYSIFPNIVEIMRMTSAEASAICRRENQEFDAVYIDAIHDEENIVKDVYGWLPMIRKGGMIGGHDYIKSYTPMAKALDAIFEDRINLMIVDPSRPALSYKNTAQGGNWWVFVNNKWKKIWMERIEALYPQHIEAMK